MEENLEFTVQYGVTGNYTDVTNIALSMLAVDGVLVLPGSDCGRAEYFGDPIPYVVKHVCITSGGKQHIYPANESVTFDVSHLPKEMFELKPTVRTWYNHNTGSPGERLETIHRNLKFIGGNIRDEYPEQLMVVSFLRQDAKVLELGSNIGRNTLAIATILSDQKNLVTLECDPNTCKTLRKNMEINQYDFHIEESALSYRNLIQKGWDTIPSDTVLPGYSSVNCITFQGLEEKYNIQFDTLVADCEGALYYILSDYPDMLNNIDTVIMENDYHNPSHKTSVDTTLTDKGFSRIFSRGGGWGPCAHNFFEVWSKEGLDH